jgi:light-regulated signal transduction histidine kinase (bacteriophytochrome)
MNQSSSQTAPSDPDFTAGVTLTNCDREPIHIPGSIQPHGVLLVLREPDLQIVQVSQNTADLLAIAPSELLDSPLGNFVETSHLQGIQACLEGNFEHLNPLPLTVTASNHAPQFFNGIVHRAPSGELVLELEPCLTPWKQNFFQFHHQVKNTLTQIQTTRDLTQLCNLIVQEIRAITGFDRVMVYRFNEQGDGTVIAEERQPHLEAYLGLHYPDTDVPKQAKHLYTLNWLRLIPDVNYQPSPLLSSDPITASHPLDMSYCVLRSVSPIHVEYLQNMGVSATMVISLIHQRQLWGMIACHHYTPKFVPYETRTICEFLGQLMSTEIATKEANENLDYKLQLKEIQGRFVERLAEATDFVKALTGEPELLLQLTGAQGVVVCQSNQLELIGQTPSETELVPLIAWLNDRFERDLFVTDALPKLYPDAARYQTVASGLLAMAVSITQQRYVLWFRPELPQTVTWAGNPHKQQHLEADGSLTISPRQSFEAWQEIVRGTSEPWLPCEVAGAVELRQAIVDIVLRQADELASINLDLERSNSELDAFAYIASHDLKEPLRGIHNYATFLLEDYESLLPEDGTHKLQTLVRLTQRMEAQIGSLLKFSRLGRRELQMHPIDLNLLLQDTTEVFQMSPQWTGCELRIPRPLPVVWGDRALVEEVFRNLISNACKYNTKPEKWVEIGWCDSDSEDGMVTLYIRDNGIGIRAKHLELIFEIFKRLHAAEKFGGGTGAGLTIVKKIVERHRGTIFVESVYGQGTTFYFTLPVENPSPFNQEMEA